MYYYYYKRLFPNNVLVYVEEFHKQDGAVLFDFIDSNEYDLFTNSLGVSNSFDKPSMVLLTNYKGKTIQENTIYAIRLMTIQSWQEQNRIDSENLNSFLIGYNIDVAEIDEPIFNESVSLGGIHNAFSFNYYMLGRGNISNIPLNKKGKLSVTVRNVGQGNWNEINVNNNVKIVYDAGAPMNASRANVINIIGNRNTIYPKSKPVLIVSHWDKDHYHSLIGMTDSELQNNFSAFVCRDRIPNLTSRILFKRISNAVGLANTFTITADPRYARGGATFFRPLTPLTQQVVLYNSQYHKNRNISGLALTVKTKSASVVLPGDAHYEQISRDILPHLNFRHTHKLVVPHHGGKAGIYNYIIPPLCTVGEAAISVGENRYRHPLANYIVSLTTSGFEIQQTNVLGADIVIPL